MMIGRHNSFLVCFLFQLISNLGVNDMVLNSPNFTGIKSYYILLSVSLSQRCLLILVSYIRYGKVGITIKPPPRSLRGRDHFEMKSAHDFSLFESEARMEEREKNCRSETELFQRNHHQTLSFDHHQQKQKTNSSDLSTKSIHGYKFYIVYS